MSTFRTRCLLALAGTCAAAALLHASVPTFWEVATDVDFLAGEVEHLTIDAFGRVTIGPAATPIGEAGAPFVWSIVQAPDRTVYAGTGNDGRVYRIDPDGRTSIYFDAEELEVHAIALAPRGGLYVATSPDGRIYQVDATGGSRVIFDPPDTYIWSLVVDRNGILYAGTGEPGRIYRIDANGAGRVLYDTKAAHAMALAIDSEGRLLAGTSGPGRVFRLDASGRAFVLLESGYPEIRQVRVAADGAVLATAIRGRAAGTPTRPPVGVNPEITLPATGSVPTVTAEVTAITIVADAAAGTATPSTSPRMSGVPLGAVFRIRPDGAWNTIWESRNEAPYDVAASPDGSLLLATGNEGRIYRLSGTPLEPTLVHRANAEQITALIVDARGETVFATSNPGRLFRLSASPAAKGTYTSSVRDAEGVARWGTIRWSANIPAGARLTIATRAGNTQAPDDTWSDWSAPHANPAGSPIASPSARYLQWRATFTGGREGSPALTGVTVAYLPQNLAPRVTQLTVHPPGTVFQRAYPSEPELAGFAGVPPERRGLVEAEAGTTSASLGRRTYERGLRTLTWRAEDDNHDTLSYDVFYRLQGESVWRPLARRLSDPVAVWDTTSVPDGRYVLRVVASDAATNDSASALTGARDSRTIPVDNSAPRITVQSVRQAAGTTVVAFTAQDDASTIRSAEYSVDGDRWTTIYPRDGIADSPSESFELRVEGSPGLQEMVLRATDALGNATSVRVPAVR